MIAAIYARKSNEQQGVADEAKSVARQIAHARGYAEKKGWTVPEEHTYVDDGVSGAEFVKRPGLARLLNTLSPRPLFQVLVMSEESRLGREQIETAYVLKGIMDAGVRVFFYLEDRERTLDSAMDKVMLSLTNFAAEVERERASQRVYDAARQRAGAGKVAGAKIYGYDNVPVLSAELGRDGRPKRLHTERRVNEVQAAVVRRIFRLYTEGLGAKRIAHQLNVGGVPAPRRLGWAQGGVKHMLRNEIYQGVVLWGRIQNIVKKGTRKHRYREPEEILRHEDPALRIVSEELWEAVQARRRRRGETIPRTPKGQLLGRPSWRDGHSDYLLPGFASCVVCGGPIRTVHEKHGTHGTGRRVTVRKYGCSTNQERGDAACRNRTRLRQEVLDQAVLGKIEAVLDEEMIGWAVDEVLAHLADGQDEHTRRRAELDQELGRVDHRVERALDELLDAAELAPALKARVKAEQARKAGFQAEIARLDSLRTATLDIDRLRADLMARARDVRNVLRLHVAQGRALFRRLFPEPLEIEPIEREGVRGFRFTGRLSVAGLLSGEAFSTAQWAVSPAPHPRVRDPRAARADGPALGGGRAARRRRHGANTLTPVTPRFEMDE